MTDLTCSNTRRAAALMASALLSIAVTGGCTRAPRSTSEADDATRLRLSQLSEPSGDIDQQLSIVAAAAAREPSNQSVQMRYATALSKAGRYQQALTVAEPIYAKSRDQISSGLLVGRLQIQLDQASAAGATYRDILGREPSHIEALNGLGITDVMQGALAAAETDFRRAVGIAPTDRESRNNLALALALEQRTEEAIPMLRDLLREDTVSRPVRTNLALAYVVSGNRGKAVEMLSAFMSAAEADKTVDTYARLDRHAQAATSRTAPERIALSSRASRVDETRHQPDPKPRMVVVAAAATMASGPVSATAAVPNAAPAITALRVPIEVAPLAIAEPNAGGSGISGDEITNRGKVANETIQRDVSPDPYLLKPDQKRQTMPANTRLASSQFTADRP